MTQNNLIVVPEGGLPAHVVNKQAKIGNQDLVDGISTGAPPSIVLKGTRFALKSEGEERIVDATTIKLVILQGRPGLYKAWYATNYDPGQAEGKAPDCHSKDGIKPDADSTLKQAETCAGCRQNQFGSGKNEKGEVTKGKACSDNKIAAVFYDGRAWQLKIPPASLRAFGDYVRQLGNHDIDASRVITVVGFNPQMSHPVLTFQYGGFLPEAAVPKIDEFKASDEVENIINPVYVAATTDGIVGTEKPAMPAPEQPAVAAAADVADVMGTADPAPAQAAQPAAQPVQPATVAQPEVQQAPPAAEVDPLAGLTDTSPAAAQPAQTVETQAAQVDQAPGNTLDADSQSLADELGLEI